MHFKYLLPDLDYGARFAQTSAEEDENEISISPETDEGTNFRLFPNPANNEVRLNYTSENYEKVEMFMFDAVGRKILQLDLRTNVDVSFRTDAMAGGIYFVHLLKDGHVLSGKKLVIQK